MIFIKELAITNQLFFYLRELLVLYWQLR